MYINKHVMYMNSLIIVTRNRRLSAINPILKGTRESLSGLLKEIEINQWRG